MQSASHQTVKLGKGRHASPEHGVCVMELASMLAGEPFSDRPRSVSPAIAAFLRAYNDLLDDRSRQRLYELAADVVGTVGNRDVEERRVRRLVEWGEQMRRARRWLLTLPARRPMTNHGRIDPDEAGIFAVRSMGRSLKQSHAEVVALLRELIELGPSRTDSPAAPSRDRVKQLSRVYAGPRSLTSTLLQETS